MGIRQYKPTTPGRRQGSVSDFTDLTHRKKNRPEKSLLEPKPTEATEAIRHRRLDQKPYWDLERARVGDSRKVPVEVIVNGYPVEQKEIVADGSEHEVSFSSVNQNEQYVAVVEAGRLDVTPGRASIRAEGFWRCRETRTKPGTHNTQSPVQLFSSPQSRPGMLIAYFK